MRPTSRSTRLCAVASLVLVAGLAVPACRSAGPPDVQAPADGRRHETLFLTWAEDPTTTMLVQWVEPGETMDLTPGGRGEVVTDVPRVAGVALDGALGDWTTQGFAVVLVADPSGKTPVPADQAATVRWGWDERGLLLAFRVTDDVLIASPDPEALWKGDGVELFVSDATGARPFQVIIAAAMAEGAASPRVQVLDRRGDAGASPIVVDAALAVGDGGYVIEACVPWAAIGQSDGAAAPADTRLRLQAYAKDVDADGESTLVWFPVNDTHAEPLSSRVVVMGPPDDAPAGEQVRARWNPDDRLKVDLIAPADFAGRAFALTAADRVVATGRFEPGEHAARGSAAITPPGNDRRPGALDVQVDGRVAGYVLDEPHRWTLPVVPVAVAFAPVDRPTDWQRQATDVRPFGNSAWFIQRAHLRGLSPDTDYLLRVSDDPLARVHRFRTAPATLDRPLTFAEGGDIGVGPVVPDLHRMAASWDPLFGLVGGDLAYANGVDLRVEVEYLRLWHLHMRADHDRLIPMLVTIGNHEVRGGFAWDDRSEAPFFYSLFADAFPAHRGSYGTLDFGDYLSLIYLDTHTTPIQKQTPFLSRALEERRAVPHVFPLYHVAAYPSVRKVDEGGGRGEARKLMREQWVPLFEEARVPLVFEHDDHAYKRTHALRQSEPVEPGTFGVVYMGDGPWGRTPREPDASRPYLAVALQAYNVLQVTLDGRSARVAVFNEKSEPIDRFEYTRGE